MQKDLKGLTWSSFWNHLEACLFCGGYLGKVENHLTEEMIRVNTYEAQQILNIRLSWRLPPDKLIWHWEKEGKFSKVSLSHSIWRRKQKQPWSILIQRSRVVEGDLEGKSANCVKKKKQLWRWAKSVSPTRHRLEKKGPTLDTTCPLCYNDVEW